VWVSCIKVFFPPALRVFFSSPISPAASTVQTTTTRRSSPFFSSTLACRAKADAAAASARVRVATSQVSTIEFSCSSEIGAVPLRPSLGVNERSIVVNSAGRGVQRGEGERGRDCAGFDVCVWGEGEGVRTWAVPLCSDRTELSNRAPRERNADYKVPPRVRAVRCQRVHRARREPLTDSFPHRATPDNPAHRRKTSARPRKDGHPQSTRYVRSRGIRRFLLAV